MIKRQNSEKIFLQPIDQHYNEEDHKDEIKFTEDYDKMIDCLNISTDSETISRKDSSDYEDLSYRIEDSLTPTWRDNVNQMKMSQVVFFKNMFFHKIAMFRNTIENGFRGRTYSCPNNKNVRPEMQYVNYFGRRSSDVLPSVCVEKSMNFFEDNGAN